MGIRELKRLARRELGGNYLRCVAAGMIYTAATFGMAGVSGQSVSGSLRALLEQLLSRDPIWLPAALAAGLSLFTWRRLLSALLDVFVWNPLEIGARRFFIDNALTGRSKLLDIPYSLREHYLRRVAVMLLREITVLAWTLLFIVPGIVKAYSYRMVPLLLAEYPDLPAKEIFRRSEEMMRGNRIRLFRLELSFIGWNLLSSLLGRLPQYLYAAPMLNICYARFYNELLEARTGRATE